MRCILPMSARLVVAILFACAPLFAQLQTRGGGKRVALTQQTVDATVEDGLAHVAVRQVFRYGGWGFVEAIYTFPLPDGAALTGLALTTGGVRNEAVLADRKQAREVYDDIVRTKRDPALLEQIGEGLFRLSVFPVAPNVDTIIELEYIQRVPLLQGAYRLTVPLGGDAARDATTSATVEMRAAAGLGAVVASAPGAEVTRHGAQRAVVSYEQAPHRDGAPPDGLTVTAELANREPSFELSTYRDARGEAWFVAAFSPGSPEETALLPKDVVLLLDTSGSMKGPKLEQARVAARWLVGELRDEDRVNIVRFSTDVEAVLPDLALATPATRIKLLEAIERFEAKGSTALGDALAHVAALPPAPGRARTVVLVTDGRPTFGIREPESLVALGRHLGEVGLRLHAFGVGRDVDDALLHGIALAARGHAEVFENPLEVEARLRRFLSRTAAPGLQDLKLTNRGVAVSSLHPRTLPEAYFGEQVVFAGRLVGDGPAEFELDGVGADGPRTFRAVDIVPGVAHGRRSVERLYASLRMDDLSEAARVRAGLDDAAYRTAVEGWNAIDQGWYTTKTELVDELVRTSLEHGVQCAYTSFLALDERDLSRLSGASADDFPRDTENPFADAAFNDVIGLGGGAGGRFAQRFGGRRNMRAGGGNGTEQALKDGLEWLKENLPAAEREWTLRAEALALLAFHGDGNTARRGTYRLVAQELLRRLCARVDSTSGAFADPAAVGRHDADAELDQLLATLAVTEAYWDSKSPYLRKTVARAMEHCGAPFLDGARAGALSSEALRVALELYATAAEAGLGVDTLRAASDEAQRRLETGVEDWMLNLVRLDGQADPTERARQAVAVASRAAAHTGPNLGAPAALRLWLAADTLHAAAGPAWETFNRHRKVTVLASQRVDGERKGSWQVEPGRDDSSDVAAATAANILTLECTIRLSR